MGEFAVEMRGITKAFGSVLASDHVDFQLKFGEVHSILGENGAGKSSLMNVLSGVYQPDEGEIIIRGEQTKVRSPRHAIDHGIGMIHQHLKLVESHTVLENMIAGKKGNFFINYKKLKNEIMELSNHFGLEIHSDAQVHSLSIAEKQRVEILKVLYKGAKILILDEPTAVLTPQETEKLFDIIRQMKADGCAIIIITHKLDEVLNISDRITILRKGKYIDTINNEGINPRKLTDLMVGQATDLKIDCPKVKCNDRVLTVKDLSVTNSDGKKVIKNIGFSVSGGEILGVAGVAGSGQKELCEAIAGLQKIDDGSIQFKNDSIVGKSPREIIKMGISMSFVPEDRLGMGLVSTMDITDNVLLKEYQAQKGLLLTRKDARTQAEHLVEKLAIDTPSVETPVRMLSGGNIQKVLLGREIETVPEMIITAYPARGLDVGSAHKVYDLLNEQKKKNVGILFIGEDLDVLSALCDRIMVICNGVVTGIADAHTISREEIGFMMAGRSLEEARKLV